MTEKVQNQTLALLREMRKEMQENFAKLNAKLAAMIDALEHEKHPFCASSPREK